MIEIVVHSTRKTTHIFIQYTTELEVVVGMRMRTKEGSDGDDRIKWSEAVETIVREHVYIDGANNLRLTSITSTLLFGGIKFVLLAMQTKRAFTCCRPILGYDK